MGNEKYVNYYVELLSSNLTDAMLKNISMQVNSKISEEIIKDLQAQIDDIIGANQGLGQEIDALNVELSQLREMRNEFENTKHQLQHLDTFRNELVKEREAHQKTKTELEAKIAKLTPVEKKPKKVDSKPVTVSNPNETLKDGGTF